MGVIRGEITALKTIITLLFFSLWAQILRAVWMYLCICEREREKETVINWNYKMDLRAGHF